MAPPGQHPVFRVLLAGNPLDGGETRRCSGRSPVGPESETVCAKVLGSLTIFLPTLAVGALSWAAAKEYKARVQSFEAMRDFLEMQRDRLQQASSDRQFRRLVEETESRLLGETVDWYFRTTVIAVPS